MYTPIQPSRLYAQIVEQIKAQILNGQLRAGDQLPTERALSEQFGVSRTAVREAITVMDTMLDDIDAFIVFDNRFHRALAKATHNPIILTLFDSIVDLLHEQRRLIGTASHGPEHGQYHHKQILATIMHPDPEAARQAMRAHLQQVREDIQAATKP